MDVHIDAELVRVMPVAFAQRHETCMERLLGLLTTQVLLLRRIWTQGAYVHIMQGLPVFLDSAHRVDAAVVSCVEELVGVPLGPWQREQIFLPVSCVPPCAAPRLGSGFGRGASRRRLRLTASPRCWTLRSSGPHSLRACSAWGPIMLRWAVRAWPRRSVRPNS